MSLQAILESYCALVGCVADWMREQVEARTLCFRAGPRWSRFTGQVTDVSVRELCSEGMHVATLLLTDEEQVALTISPKTAAGNPAQVHGAPVWASSDPAALVLQVADDGLSAVAVTTGKLGTARVSVTADADLGEGIRELTGALDVEVAAAEAVSLDIAAGTPTPRPMPTPH